MSAKVVGTNEAKLLKTTRCFKDFQGQIQCNFLLKIQTFERIVKSQEDN